MADFNGDGTADILMRDASTGTNLLWRMQGGAIGQRTVLNNLSSDWSIANVGDYNGDGTADILWRGAVTGQNLVWTMSNGSIASGQMISSLATSFSVVNGGNLTQAVPGAGGGNAAGSAARAAGAMATTSDVFTSASGTVVSNGNLYVHSGGIATHTTVQDGGIEYVLSGGVASDTVIDTGGEAIAFDGGTVSAATISGGTLEVMSGGSTGAGPVTFATSGGGILQLDHSQSFAGTVAGFGKPDFLDLRDIAFTSATTLAFVEAPSNTSGTLTVSDGIHTANITLLGQYVTAQFTKASDGAGGTLVGDPPLEEVMAGKQTIGVVNPHHT